MSVKALSSCDLAQRHRLMSLADCLLSAIYFQSMSGEVATTYYFSTHGWSCSSLGSVGFCLVLLDAAAAAARALLLKKLAAIAAGI